MAEYIEREALLNEINLQKRSSKTSYPKRSFVVGDVLTCIYTAPAADVVEVVHGEWVDHMVRDWHCSECGRKVPRQVYFDGYCHDDKLNYCPNCGAKMREPAGECTKGNRPEDGTWPGGDGGRTE